MKEKLNLNQLQVGDEKMEHSFSVEMKSKKYVRHMSVSNESREHVLFEGSLGELIEISMIEGAVLEVKGANGILRIDLSEDELRNVFSQKKNPPRKKKARPS